MGRKRIQEGAESVKTGISLSEPQMGALDSAAGAMGLTRGALIRQAVDDRLRALRVALDNAEGYSTATNHAHGLLLGAKTAEGVDAAVRRMLAEWRVLAIEARRSDLLTERDVQVIRLMAACARRSLALGYSKPVYSLSLLGETVEAGR